MKKFILTPVTSFEDRATIILAGLMFSILLSTGAWGLWHLFYKPFVDLYYPFGLLNFSTPTLAGNIAMGCFFAPLWEELAFRHLPIQFAKTLSPNMFWPIVLVSNCIFGYMHGGPQNILMQGSTGFILACVYIKTGYNYWSSVIVHGLFNTSLMYILPFLMSN